MATKEHLLSKLKASKGKWLSGEALSRDLEVSRCAIWKQVAALKKQGYLIQSAPKKGYRLREVSTKLLPEEIREGLENKVFGKKEIIHLEECDSTNRIGKELANKGASEGVLIVAEKQTQGRGRLGREWFSPPGEGIYVTMVLRPALPPSEAPKITLLTGVALAESLRASAGVHAKIKWPNDILLGKKKLAGILTELSAEVDAVNYVLIGVGVNVNTRSFPPELEETATSLLIETGESFSRVSLVKDFLGRFEGYYFESQDRGFEEVLQRWNKMSDTLGKQVRVVSGGTTYAGEALGVDKGGALLLKKKKGELIRLVSGDVALN